MIATHCICGFAELGDETVTDHLHHAFTPHDMRGKDGQIHEEGTDLACSCGFTGRRQTVIATEELDEHFIEAFMPDDGIGRDGRKHGRAETA
jgi:hypothetical protein